MGKKNKDQEPVANISSVANRDIIQRINFLYQASTYLSSVSQSLPKIAEGSCASPPSDVNRKTNKKAKLRHPKNTAELSRSYIGTMRIVGQKTMVRMDPALKRALCKGCDTVLLPGSSATVRVKPLASHGQGIVYTCSTCDTSRRIPAPPVLDADTLNEGGSVSTDVNSAPSASASVPQPTTAGVSETDVNSVHAASGTSHSPSKGRRRQRRAKRVARVPPLFERKGHVTFRGNERLPEVNTAA
ncbi:Rpr2-domain-containing protein [Pilatotrama ljubarskyi]|nr:Rpr2-domain-containing protein [Pilatotrama ljubarskyi]